MNNNLSFQIDLITNYLNNILNINILLVTVGLILIYWSYSNKNSKKLRYNFCNYIFYIAVLIGVFAIILNLFIYRNIISEFTVTGLNPAKPYTPNPTKHLSNLDLIFYFDLIIIVLLWLGFIGRNHAKNNK